MMGYSIELYFETPFERKILALWETLSQADVPSYYQRMGGRPHLTLAVCERIDEDHLCPLLRSFSQSIPQFTVHFPAVALIQGNQYGVYFTPLVTRGLIDMHAALYDVLHDSGNDPVDRYTPGSWLPHSPVSKQQSFAEAIKTIALCSKSQLCDSAQVVELGLIKFPPSQPIQVWSLGIAGSLDKIYE